MAYVPVAFSFGEVLTSAEMTQLNDNVDYLKARSDAVGTVVTAAGTSDQTGAVGADVIYGSADLVVPAGTWLIEAGATLINMTTADWCAVGLYNVTTTADVANSRGAGATASTTIGVSLGSRPVVLALAGPTTFRVKAFRNGGSSLKFNGTGVAGAPAAWLNAVRLVAA